MYNGNGRPLSKKKQVQVMIALTILAWATQTLRHQWGFGADVQLATSARIPAADTAVVARDADDSASSNGISSNGIKMATAIAALNSAATGFRALSTQIDVITNNLANVETTAFKGTQIGNTQLDLTQGRPDQTNRDEDVAIQGTGFFRVKTLSTRGDGTAYTRNGNLFVNKTGELVVGSADGYRLDPSIRLPRSTTDIQITQDGLIIATVAGKTAPIRVGTLELSTFVNPQGLSALGGGFYQETHSSGPPVTGTPGQNGTGQILQTYLEESNVDLVKELVTLIKIES
jgi:flagellar basal-body rod protein FlgG